MELKDCDQPWFELQFEYSTKVGCCCYYRGTEDTWSDNSKPDIQKFWNSEIMQEKRRIIAGNDARGTGCEGCQAVNFGTESRFSTVIPHGMNPKQLANYQAAIESFQKKEIVVDSLPTKYYFNFGLACNIKCIHCSQTPDRGVNVRQLTSDLLMTQKENYLVADEISMIGGEPLALKQSRKFIDAVSADRDFQDVKLNIYTNATLLHQFMDKLSNMRRVGIIVSLDSIGEHYDYIRSGSDWNVVERNILKFKEEVDRRGADWTINISSILMKSSIIGLEEFVQWCAKHELAVHFAPLMSMTYAGFNTDSEDIGNFPILLNEVPDWKEKLTNAIDILDGKGWSTSSHTLKMMRSDLESRRERYITEELNQIILPDVANAELTAERPIALSRPTLSDDYIVMEGRTLDQGRAHHLREHLEAKPDYKNVEIDFMWPTGLQKETSYFFRLRYKKSAPAQGLNIIGQQQPKRAACGK